MRNQKSHTPQQEIPLKNEKPRALNGEVIETLHFFQFCNNFLYNLSYTVIESLKFSYWPDIPLYKVRITEMC